MLRTLLAASLALGLASAANAQVVGQPAPGTPCMITKVQPADVTVGHNYNLVFCGNQAYSVAASTYTNVVNPEIWVTLGSAAAIGRTLNAEVGPLGSFPLVGSTMSAVSIQAPSLQ